ncbi:MAG TPA: NAD(P)H-dependent oxidoreductase [Myxococcota bacterium]
MTRILLVNGALRGSRGDTAAALAHCAKHATDRGAVVDTLVLADLAAAPIAAREVVARVENADALILGTGTVWSSPSSVMTRFLEVLTPRELDPAFLGKPAAAVVTMDSVGGVEAGSRLLVALTLMGFALPPCALVALARTSIRDVDDAHHGDEHDADVWSPRDLPVLIDNVLAMAQVRPPYRAWSVRQARAVAGDYPAVAGLDLGLPRALPPNDDNDDDDDDDDE